MWLAIRLKFESPLHIGSDIAQIGIESVQPMIHSDTLFSAICNVWASLSAYPNLVYMPIEEMLDQFQTGEPPFRLSSCFPYKEEEESDKEEEKWYLPKPLTPPADFVGKNKDSLRKYGKDVKRKQFIPVEILEKWIAGDLLGDENLKIIAETGFEKVYQEQIVPRVTLDRHSAKSNIFHYGVVHFDEYCGLYFLLQLRDDEDTEDWLNALTVVLKILGERGIGGERSTGCGRFVFAERKQRWDISTDPPWESLISKMEESDVAQSDGYYLLSLFHPNSDDIAKFKSGAPPVAYSLVTRRGWAFSTSTNRQQKRQTCRMLSEGSVTKHKPIGKLACVKPNDFPHPVYRYGWALSLPITIPKEVDDD